MARTTSAVNGGFLVSLRKSQIFSTTVSPCVS